MWSLGLCVALVRPLAMPKMIRTPSARLAVDLDAIAANWRTVARRAAPAETGAVLKADAYGLGAERVLVRLAQAGCRDFFVATWDEATALLPLAPGCSVHVLNGVAPEAAALARDRGVVPVLNSPEACAIWRAIAPGHPCDVMIDSGLNRLGLAPADAGEAARGLNVDVCMSHLACADDAADPANAAQLATFAGASVPARRRSLAASAGVWLGPAYAFDLVRPGLALYGGQPCAAATGLAPAFAVHARVLQTRDLAPGDPVGYGRTWVAARPSRIAVLGAGYADGIPRAGGVARLDGTDCPVVGRVSMDLTAIDVTDARRAAVRDWAELLFDLPRAAALSGRSQYELLTGLGTRFERTYTGA